MSSMTSTRIRSQCHENYSTPTCLLIFSGSIIIAPLLQDMGFDRQLPREGFVQAVTLGGLCPSSSFGRVLSGQFLREGVAQAVLSGGLCLGSFLKRASLLGQFHEEGFVR